MKTTNLRARLTILFHFPLIFSPARFPKNHGRAPVVRGNMEEDSPAAGETTLMNGVIRRVRLAVLAGADGASDKSLLEAFLTRRDDTAFAALVRRHGPMVLGVCRRVLRQEEDAEDAFQAAFVVLARRAATVRAETLGCWLYGVAYRTAMKAKVMSAKRRNREQEIGRMSRPEPRPDESWQELVPLLDRELSRLPDKYRTPVVLCDLQGKSRKDAAGQLNVPEGTLSSRLNRARALLARRLTRHGPAATAGAVALALTNEAPARVSARLLISTVTAATGPTPAGVTALTEGVLKVMFLERLKVVTSVALSLALVGLGVAAACQAPPGADQGGGGGGGVQERKPGGESRQGKGARDGVTLPEVPMPSPAAVRLDDSGRIVVRTATMAVRFGGGGMMGPGGFGGKGGGKKAGGGVGPGPGGIGGGFGGGGPGAAGPGGFGGQGLPGGAGGPGGFGQGFPGGAGGPGGQGFPGGAGGPGGQGFPGAGGAGGAGGIRGGGGVGGMMPGSRQLTVTYRLDEVRAFDGTGRKIIAAELARRLEKEVPALVYHGQNNPEPLHLRFLKADTLILMLPASAPGMGGGMMGFGGLPGGVPGFPGGPGGGAGGPPGGRPGAGPGGLPPGPGAGGFPGAPGGGDPPTPNRQGPGGGVSS
jgi:RNA polymerase sigma factor (sigma-70 family)